METQNTTQQVENKNSEKEVFNLLDYSDKGLKFIKEIKFKQVAYIIVALVIIQVSATALAVINVIPLFDSVLELIGLYVVATFSWNNLLKASKREELINNLKKELNEYL